jgi:hypothetical protein
MKAKSLEPPQRRTDTHHIEHDAWVTITVGSGTTDRRRNATVRSKATSLRRVRPGPAPRTRHDAAHHDLRVSSL